MTYLRKIIFGLFFLSLNSAWSAEYSNELSFPQLVLVNQLLTKASDAIKGNNSSISYSKARLDYDDHKGSYENETATFKGTDPNCTLQISKSTHDGRKKYPSVKISLIKVEDVIDYKRTIETSYQTKIIENNSDLLIMRAPGYGYTIKPNLRQMKDRKFLKIDLKDNEIYAEMNIVSFVKNEKGESFDLEKLLDDVTASQVTCQFNL